MHVYGLLTQHSYNIMLKFIIVITMCPQTKVGGTRESNLNFMDVEINY